MRFTLKSRRAVALVTGGAVFGIGIVALGFVVLAPMKSVTPGGNAALGDLDRESLAVSEGMMPANAPSDASDSGACTGGRWFGNKLVVSNDDFDFWRIEAEVTAERALPYFDQRFDAGVFRDRSWAPDSRLDFRSERHEVGPGGWVARATGYVRKFEAGTPGERVALYVKFFLPMAPDATTCRVWVRVPGGQ